MLNNLLFNQIIRQFESSIAGKQKTDLNTTELEFLNYLEKFKAAYARYYKFTEIEHPDSLLMPNKHRNLLQLLNKTKRDFTSCVLFKKLSNVIQKQNQTELYNDCEKIFWLLLHFSSFLIFMPNKEILFFARLIIFLGHFIELADTERYKIVDGSSSLYRLWPRIFSHNDQYHIDDIFNNSLCKTMLKFD